MRILFTGASSFTGFWFAKELANQGHEVIAAIRRPLQNYTGIRLERLEQASGFCRLHFDAPFGSKVFTQIIQDYPSIDMLCHHAARVENYRSPEFDVGQAVFENSFNILPTLRQLVEKGCRKIVITGSVFEPGEGSGSDGLPAVSPYGLSKALTAQIYRYYTDSLKLSLGKFVIPNPFGAMEEDRFTGYLARSWLEDSIPEVKTPDYIRDNIPVTLLAKAYGRFVESIPNQSGYISFNPSFYVSTQGDFTKRFSDHLKPLLKKDCAFKIATQTTFNEPKIRVNFQILNPSDYSWDENDFWNELAEYYLKSFQLCLSR